MHACVSIFFRMTQRYFRENKRCVLPSTREKMKTNRNAQRAFSSLCPCDTTCSTKLQGATLKTEQRNLASHQEPVSGWPNLYSTAVCSVSTVVLQHSSNLGYHVVGAVDDHRFHHVGQAAQVALPYCTVPCGIVNQQGARTKHITDAAQIDTHTQAPRARSLRRRKRDIFLIHARFPGIFLLLLQTCMAFVSMALFISTPKLDSWHTRK